MKHEKQILVENYNALYGKYESENLKIRNQQLNNENIKNKNEKESNESGELKNDLKMLKILVFRLNKHLEYYMDLLREHNIKPEGTLKICERMELEMKWGSVNSHVLAPLLNSYEERIQEKNDLLTRYEEELNDITGKVKDLIEENEKVHEMYENLKKTSDTWMAEKARLISCLEIMKYSLVPILDIFNSGPV